MVEDVTSSGHMQEVSNKGRWYSVYYNRDFYYINVIDNENSKVYDWEDNPVSIQISNGVKEVLRRWQHGEVQAS